MATVRRVLDADPEWLGSAHGDLQVHSTDSDGALPLEQMADAAVKIGRAYMACTDHSTSLKIAHGMTVEEIGAQAGRIEARNDAEAAAGSSFRLLRSIEMDVFSDGSGDMEPEVLDGLDLVLGGVPHEAPRSGGRHRALSGRPCEPARPRARASDDADVRAASRPDRRLAACVRRGRAPGQGCRAGRDAPASGPARRAGARSPSPRACGGSRSAATPTMRPSSDTFRSGWLPRRWSASRASASSTTCRPPRSSSGPRPCARRRRDAARGRADAREAPARDPAGRGLDVRAEVGRVPHASSRCARRRRRARKPRRSPDGPVLPRDRGARGRSAHRPARCRRRARHGAATRALSFDELQLRLHPAASRVRKLAAEIPATLSCSTCSRTAGEDLRRPAAEVRRERLAALAERIGADRDARAARRSCPPGLICACTPWTDVLEIADVGTRTRRGSGRTGSWQSGSNRRTSRGCAVGSR